MLDTHVNVICLPPQGYIAQNRDCYVRFYIFIYFITIKISSINDFFASFFKGKRLGQKFIWKRGQIFSYIEESGIANG